MTEEILEREEAPIADGAEENIQKLAEEDERLSKENERLSEENKKLSEENERLSEELEKMKKLPAFCAGTTADRSDRDAIRSIFRKK